LDTKEVLKAARTKWNFLPFEPGLVGGHCIGVDPYYLARKAKEVGYIPRLILAGRGINEEIPEFIAQETVKLMIQNNAEQEYSIMLIDDYNDYGPFDAVIVAVKHKIFMKDIKLSDFISVCTKPCILIDIKGIYDKNTAQRLGIVYWCL